MKTRMITAVGLAALLAVAAGYALQGEGWSLKANVSFPFMVGNKLLPAGDYTFDRQGPLGQVFRVQGEGKNATVVNVITRIASDIHTTPQDAHLVFDVVGGDKYILAEIWIPGEDGYVLAVTKEKHEHKVMNIQK